MFYVNAGGMRSKLLEFFTAVTSCNYQVIAITETWLINSIFDGEITPPGWQIFRKDRHGDTDISTVGGS